MHLLAFGIMVKAGTQGCIHVYLCVCGDQRDQRLMPDVFLHHSLPRLLKQGLFTEAGTPQFSKLVDQWAPGILLSPSLPGPPELGLRHQQPGSYMDVLDPNSASTVNTLLTGPPCQSLSSKHRHHWGPQLFHRSSIALSKEKGQFVRIWGLALLYLKELHC